MCRLFGYYNVEFLSLRWKCCWLKWKKLKVHECGRRKTSWFLVWKNDWYSCTIFSYSFSCWWTIKSEWEAKRFNLNEMCSTNEQRILFWWYDCEQRQTRTFQLLRNHITGLFHANGKLMTRNVAEGNILTLSDSKYNFRIVRCGFFCALPYNFEMMPKNVSTSKNQRYNLFNFISARVCTLLNKFVAFMKLFTVCI